MTVVPCELMLGTLPLTSEASEALNLSFVVEASADGTEWGNPEAVIVSIKSQLQDGSLSLLTHYDNRTATVRMRVFADDYDGLAEGEQALAAQVAAQRSTLTWTPPQSDAVPTVFDTVTMRLELDFNDLSENRLERFYTLALECEPFGRSDTEVVVPGVPVVGSPTTVDIDTCDATTGWTGEGSGAVTSSGGAVRIDAETESGVPYTASLTRTGGVSMGATPFLRIDLTLPWMSFSFEADGTPIIPVAQTSSPGSGSVWLEPPASFTALTVLASAPGPFELGVTNIARTDESPSIGTTRQRMFTLDVAGSARAQAALEVFDETPANLGVETLVYTRPSGSVLQPPLSPWWVSGPTRSTDTANVSGETSVLDDVTPTRFEIPADLLETGTYALLARIGAAAGGEEIDWEVSLTETGGSDYFGPTQSGSTVLALPSTPGIALANTTWIHHLAAVTLPPTRVQPGTRFVVRVDLTTLASSLILDEGWLFNLDTGALSWVMTYQDGDPVCALRINTATAEYPRPEYLAAPGPDDWADGRNADARVRAWGIHSFEPGLTDVLTVTTTSDEAQVALRYHPRWHTHARS